jgi:hypothetical protein
VVLIWKRFKVAQQGQASCELHKKEKSMIRRILTVCLVFSLVALSVIFIRPSSALAATPASIQGLHVSGNKIVNRGSYPAKVNSFWYVSYNSSVAWGHFETK